MRRCLNVCNNAERVCAVLPYRLLLAGGVAAERFSLLRLDGQRLSRLGLLLRQRLASAGRQTPRNERVPYAFILLYAYGGVGMALPAASLPARAAMPACPSACLPLPTCARPGGCPAGL